MIPHKKCGTCGEVKMKIEFSKAGHSSDGLQTDCKSCDRVRRSKGTLARSIICRDEPLTRQEWDNCVPEHAALKLKHSKAITKHAILTRALGTYYKDNPETKRAANLSRFTHPELPRIEEEQKVRYRKADVDEARAKDGFVYVITHPQLEGVKIGKARNPNKRLADANTWCPTGEFTLHDAVYSDDASKLEREVHKVLAHHRLDGEWFAVSKDKAIRTVKEVHKYVDTNSGLGRQRTSPCAGHHMAD